MRIVLLIIGLMVFNQTNAQYHLAKHYTINEGLPSNDIYSCFKDPKGFLWLASDQGMARFDGIRFEKFTVAEGLPDNDAFIALLEKNGTIWVIGANNRIAYFDPVKNKFINGYSDTRLANLRNSTFIRPFIINNGGICIAYNDSSFICTKERITAYGPLKKGAIKSAIISILNDNSFIRLGYDTTKPGIWHLYHVKGDRIIAVSEGTPGKPNYKPYIDEGKVYFMPSERKKIIVVSIDSSQQFRIHKDSIELKEKIFWHAFTPQYLCILSDNGQITFYDKKTFKLLFTFDCKACPFNFYEDLQKNFWIPTYGSGLKLYSQRKIFELPLPEKYASQRYLSITKNKNGHLLFGNISGEIIETNGPKIQYHKRLHANKTDIQRKIISTQNKIFTFGEGGMYVNYTKKIKRKVSACKVAYLLNDSTILCGFLKGMCAIDTRTDKITEYDIGDIEVTSFTANDPQGVYIGAQDSLYYYSFTKKQLSTLQFSDNKLLDRIVALNTTPDKLVWVATASNGVFVLKDHIVIHHITIGDGLRTNSILSLANGRPQQLWIGTNEGISILNYSIDQKFNIKKIQNISVHDGLTSNIITQMNFANDTMYAATEHGISIIPASIKIEDYNIAIELTNIKINNRDTTLSNYYKLLTRQRNINVQFTGVELTGHFKNAQISQDEGQTWSDVDANSISFQFGSGKNNLWFRSVDVNGHIGTKILKIVFDIQAHYYETWWFPLIISIAMLLLAMLIYSYLTKKKHQRVVEKFLQKQLLDEFEIQSLKAQINPHFIFNCLNSIKGFIYDEDLEKAEIYLQKFSDLLRSTLSYSTKSAISLSAELQYIDTYLSLEKLRFTDKFEYTIYCPPEINQDNLQIPAMLLQPFVENAIKHGICNRKGSFGNISISMYLGTNELTIIIDDNGVGRDKSAEIKKQRAKNHESKGTALTQRRLELHKIYCEIIDKMDDNRNASGTKIILKLPMPLYKQTTPNE